VDDPLAVALKFGFIAVLYLFLLWVARSAMRDLSRYEGASGSDDGRSGSNARPDTRPRLEVVAALGHEPGTAFDVVGGATMGRAEMSDIPVEDPFASSAHARVFPRGEFMYIEDMGSTNGTYLNGRQLERAEQLRASDVIRIGDSEYRYRE
jgi:FHA domain